VVVRAVGVGAVGKRPSYNHVMSLLRYNPRTGELTWRAPAPSGRRPGDIAGAAGGRKHFLRIKVVVDGHPAYAHHIAWLLMTGRWPKTLITFRDGDGTNCRWRNLMATTIKRLHTHNRIYRNNTSGYRGVNWHSVMRKWFARIKVDKREIFLGYFPSKKGAIAARKRAAKRYGYRQ
jgi:hypothetical protein